MDKSIFDIIDAVLDNGADKWYQIGRRMGFTNPEVAVCTGPIVTPRGKLESLISRKQQEVGDEQLRKLLISVCERLRILGAVMDQLRF